MLQFKGEAPLITGYELVDLIGFDRLGIIKSPHQFNEEPWLHFSDNGREVYIAKKPFKHSISWDQLNALNITIGNNIIIHKNECYLVRLIRAVNVFGDDLKYEYNPRYGKSQFYSEWVKYMYRVYFPSIHSVYGKWLPNVYSSEIGELGCYSDEDLHTRYVYGPGTFTWTQNGSIVGGARLNGPVNFPDTCTNLPDCGWRPVLEKINL